jgi:peptidoglycan hydrolase-like protein with peptidoglycan-binding domain
VITRFLLLLVIVGFVSGCATAQAPSALNQLQIKVARLEQAAAQNDQAVTDLKTEVTDLSQRVDDCEAGPRSAAVTSSAPRGDADFEGTVSEKDKDIIRVPVSAQKVQEALKNAGYYTGALDGKIGSKTKEAIAQFQKDHGLKSDGIIGRNTWAEMKSYLK